MYVAAHQLLYFFRQLLIRHHRPRPAPRKLIDSNWKFEAAFTCGKPGLYRTGRQPKGGVIFDDTASMIGDEVDRKKPQYLNSGIFFSWSLLAFSTTWSGYQLSFRLADVDALPVVLVEALPVLPAPSLDAVFIGSLANFS